MNWAMITGVVAATAAKPYCSVAYPGTGTDMWEVTGQIRFTRETQDYVVYDAGETWTLTSGGSRYFYLYAGWYRLVYIPEVDPFSPSAWAIVSTNYLNPDYTGWLPDVWDDYKSSTASTPPTGAWNGWAHFTTEADRATVSGHPTGGVNTTYEPYEVDGTRLKYVDTGWTPYYMVWLSNYWYICTDSGDIVATAVAKKSSTSTTPPSGAWNAP